MPRYKSVFTRNTSSAILKLEPYVAGPTFEEIMRVANVSSDEVIKLSSNENPLGPSPKAIEAIHNAAARVSLYPNARCERLRKAIECNCPTPGLSDAQKRDGSKGKAEEVPVVLA